MIKYHCYKCKRELSNLNSKCECSNNSGILVIDDEKFYVNKHTKEVICYCGSNEFKLEISKGILSKKDLYIVRCSECGNATNLYYDATNTYMKFEGNKYMYDDYEPLTDEEDSLYDYDDSDDDYEIFDNFDDYLDE